MRNLTNPEKLSWNFQAEYYHVCMHYAISSKTGFAEFIFSPRHAAIWYYFPRPTKNAQKQGRKLSKLELLNKGQDSFEQLRVGLLVEIYQIWN